MPNTLLTSQVITNELLMRFINNLGFSRTIEHPWDDKFAVPGAKIGDTLKLREPVEFTVSKTRVITPQDVNETNKVLQLTTQANVSFQFNSAELTLSVDDFAERYIKSAAVALANQVDVDGLTLAYQSTFNSVGAPGTPIAALDPFYQAGEILDNFSTPMDGDRYMCIPPKIQTAVLKAAQGLFQSSTEVKKQYEKGRMGTMGGFDWLMDQNCRTHTVGPLGGAPQVGAAGQTGSTLSVTGFSAAAALRMKKGDQFTLPTVFSVNRVSSDPHLDLAKFTLTADASSDASGNASLSIYPPILTSASGALQTVTNSPAAGAPLTIIGTANQLEQNGLAYHKAAFCMGMAPLEMPKDVHFGAVAIDPDTKCSIRTVSKYDIINDLFITRCDILYGHCAQRPEWSVRVQQ